MSDYIELYKKYRPRNWNEVIGQDAAVKQLKSIVLTNKLPTGFAFFAGPGVGKTTLARILTKTLNCDNLKPDENGDLIEPCNECSVCKSIDNNSLPGFSYISAADGVSADDVRKITEKARLSYPINKAVTIIDETHNLSNQAFDSLLIPLESEKMKTLFIFCSTEPDKIRPAVLSRLQVLTFPPVHWKVLAQHLYNICKKEGVADKVEKNDLISCAKSASGSVRNAIQMLESLLNDGSVPNSLSSSVIEAISKGDVVSVLQTSTEISNEGGGYSKTLETLFKEFTIALQVSCGATNDSTKDSEKLAKLGPSYLIKSIEILGDGINGMKNKNIDSKVLFEIPVIKVAILAKKILK